MNTIFGADLFCGAGGTSTGLLQAAREVGMPMKLFALNHWQVALTTHGLNHPDVQHLWADIEGIDPRRVVPGGRLRVLVASPECIYHSRARGGKPINDQRRSSADYVLEWARGLQIDDILVENVPEFEQWGPLYPADYPVEKLQLRPIPERAGEEFRRFTGTLEGLGYRVEWRTLCAADYGDATTRTRFFLRARRNGGAITWPTPTHPRSAWRAAREIIDWSVSGRSIYGRKQPLCPATMKRILAGFRKFSGLQPFLVQYHGSHEGTTSGERRHQSLDLPLPTQDTSNRFGLVNPYLVKLYGGHDACSLDAPLGTVTASFEHYALAEPYLVVLRNHADARTLNEPIPTVCAEGQHLGLAQPYLVNMKGKSTAANIQLPLPTQTAHAQHLALAEPYLTKYYGTGTAITVDEPLDTVTTKDRFALTQPCLIHPGARDIAHLLRALDDSDPLYRPPVVEIDGERYLVDFLYRMLMPRELAASMSFPEDYRFTGTQGDQVKQIGNAVPIRQSTALCRSMLI